ncbi:hypothetical protein HYU40_00215 [Candidatus Woesearchaeota archaeon]|nr:hypothetical protein [Candidatus Woesearchaeota archaeon]
MVEYDGRKVDGQRVVLFVCTGGVYRSGWATYFFNYHNKKKGLYLAKSAGVQADSVDPRHVNAAITLMKEKGIDMSSYIPVQLTNDLLKEAWRVYLLSKHANWRVYPLSKHANFTLLEASVDVEAKPVLFSFPFQNPISQGIGGKRKIRDDLEAMVLKILKELS